MAPVKVYGVIFYLLIALHIAECKSGYMLTFPSQLQIGAKEKFCLTLYNVTTDVNLNVTISCFGKEIHHKPKTFHAGEYGCFTWNLPDSLTTGTCNLAVQGRTRDGGYTFGETQEVHLVDTHQITFVQTDRPVYKPGDLVRFRILTVTQDMLPVLSKVETVTIIDPNGYFMKEWSDLPAQSGLVSLEYQLYEEPVLGTWEITTVVNGRKTVQEMPVQQYVLPKFQVTTTLPKVLNVATKNITFEACARYTFGMPVDGEMTASVCLKNVQTSWFCETIVRPCGAITTQINGCHSVTMDTEKFDITNRKYSLLCEPRLVLDVNVTEKLTGVTVHETQEGPQLWEERVKLKFVSNKYFKPYFPYIGKVLATYQDGSPSANETIVLTVNKLEIKKRLTTDAWGYANFTIQNLTHTTDFFIMKAKTSEHEYIDKDKYIIFPASTEKHVKQWYSPSSSHLQLSSNKEGPLHCGSHVSMEIAYTLQPTVFAERMFYQVISKGNTITAKDISDQVEFTRPHFAATSGPVLTPTFKKRPAPDKDNKLPLYTDLSSENMLPQGPPGSLRGPVGPPASDVSAAGPPGSPDVQHHHQQQGPPIEGKDKMEDGSSKEGSNSTKVWVAPFMWSLTFDLHITHQMAPIVRVLAYMVNSNGEMVADTLDLQIHHCHRNKVKMTFTEKTARPGDDVKLKVSAPAKSLCSTTVVDKSTYLLAGVNLLQEKEVNARLSEFDLTSDFLGDWRYCSSSSHMPPLMSPAGDTSNDVTANGGSPGFYEKTPFGPFLRKKRSLMQFYSNMYDSLLAFKVAGVTALTDLNLQTRPCLHDGDMVGPPNAAGDPRGPVPGYGNIDELEPADEPRDTKEPVTRFRRNFPENWLWDLYEIPDTGSVTLSKKMPDTITEWIGNSFCINEEHGLGVSSLAKITGFQPFFMSVKLPYSAIRGERVHVDVTVFNYMSHCLAIQVSLINSGQFTKEPNTDQAAQFCICSGKAQSYTFVIRPTYLGTIGLTLTAFLREHRIDCRRVGAPAGFKNKQVTDIVIKQLRVQAEGVTEEQTSSEYICPQDFGASYKKSVQANLPIDLIVPGSLRGRVNVIGDIMGPVLGGLDELVLLPMGCGEQNMARLAPNIAVLRYLTSTNQLTDTIETKAVDHLYKGYQQQLKFMHPDGSYSAFGGADDEGSTWLSAFVFKSLQLALDFMYIDRKQIQTKTWEFLITQQGEDGCFNEHGKVLSKYMMGGVIGSKQDQRKALTGYILVAMLESFKMMRENTPPFIALAVRCIEEEELTDTYTLAMTTYAMTMYKPTSQFTETLLEKLKQKAVVKDDMMYWKRDRQPDILSGQGRAPSAEIEITSYALLALLTKNENVSIQEVIPIVRWLTSQRNAYGGFASTQDTVVALQALSLFAKRIYGEGLDVTINVENGDHDSLDFQVLPSNSIILQQKALTDPTSEVVIKAKGEGCVVFQTSYQYNVKNTVSKLDVFKVKVTTPITKEIINNNCRARIIKVCTSYIGQDDVSNMVVAEVKLTSGWIPNVSTLDKRFTLDPTFLQLMNSVELGLKKYEMDRTHPDVVNFYFDEFSATELCFDFSTVLEVDVEDAQPAYVTVLDYYESDAKTIVEYSLSECSEDHIQKVDVQVEENDLYIEEPTPDNHQAYQPADFSFTNPDTQDGAQPAESVPASSTGPQCPVCVSTGVVNILDKICQKQIWVLESIEGELSVQFLASVGVSPPVTAPVPVHLRHCDTCHQLILSEGVKSLVVLKISDWDNLGQNLMNEDVVVLPWSQHLQQQLQTVLLSCDPV